jgi:hypothetical protein
MAQYVKVIQKNKGAFKNYLKKIEQIQDYKATCGIHKDVGRIKVKSGSIKKPKNKGALKIKGEYKQIVEAKKRATSSRKTRINLATLSSILERHITWTQKNSATITGAGGNIVTIQAGAKMRQPARIFIHLEKASNVWAEVQHGVQFETMRYLLELQRSRGKRSGQNLFKEIAEKVSGRQRQRILNKETEVNSKITQMIKGFNWPLFDRGFMLRSIDGRVVRNSTGRKVRCAYVATNVDEMIRKINSSVR